MSTSAQLAMEAYRTFLESGTLADDHVEDAAVPPPAEIPGRLGAVASRCGLHRGMPEDIAAFFYAMVAAGKTVDAQSTNEIDFCWNPAEFLETLSPGGSGTGLSEAGKYRGCGPAEGGLLYFSVAQAARDQDSYRFYMVDAAACLAGIYGFGAQGGVWTAVAWDDLWRQDCDNLLSDEMWREVKEGRLKVPCPTKPRLVAPSLCDFFRDWQVSGALPRKTYVPKADLEDKARMLKILQQDGMVLERASEELRSDHEPVETAMKQEKKALQFASLGLRGDRSFLRTVMESTRDGGKLLQYATEELRSDFELVLFAMQNSDGGGAFEFVAPELQRLPEVAVELNPSYRPDLVKLLPQELFASRDFVFAAVQKNGVWLEQCSEAFGDDRELVLAAVANTGCALSFASARLRADREVVLEALKTYGDAFQYASDALRADRTVVYRALCANGSQVVKHTTDEIKGDRGFLWSMLPPVSIQTPTGIQTFLNPKGDCTRVEMRAAAGDHWGQRKWLFEHRGGSCYRIRCTEGHSLNGAKFKEGVSFRRYLNCGENNDVFLASSNLDKKCTYTEWEVTHIEKNMYKLHVVGRVVGEPKFLSVDKRDNVYLDVSGDKLWQAWKLPSGFEGGGCYFRLMDCAEAIRYDVDIVKALMLRRGAEVLKETDEEDITCDPDLWDEGLRLSLEELGTSSFIMFPPRHLQDDEDFLLPAVRRDGMALKFMSDDAQNLQSVVIEAVRQNPAAIEYAGREIDRDYVREQASHPTPSDV